MLHWVHASQISLPCEPEIHINIEWGIDGSHQKSTNTAYKIGNYKSFHFQKKVAPKLLHFLMQALCVTVLFTAHILNPQ